MGDEGDEVDKRVVVCLLEPQLRAGFLYRAASVPLELASFVVLTQASSGGCRDLRMDVIRYGGVIAPRDGYTHGMRQRGRGTVNFHGGVALFQQRAEDCFGHVGVACEKVKYPTLGFCRAP